MLEHIIRPNSIYVLFLLRNEESSEPFNSVIFETPTKLIPIGHIHSPKTFLPIHTKLPLIVTPVRSAQMKAPIRRGLARVFWVLVVEYSEAMEGVALPAAGVADFGVGVVKHAVSVELALAVEFSLVFCSV